MQQGRERPSQDPGSTGCSLGLAAGGGRLLEGGRRVESCLTAGDAVGALTSVAYCTAVSATVCRLPPATWEVMGAGAPLWGVPVVPPAAATPVAAPAAPPGKGHP
jgi:hypothetical protein